MNAEKTIVLGLDGAHFELIESWLEEGKLPNIAQAIENGVTTNMQSVLPPVTSPNWKAYATGKNPGKLGIFWWENIDMKNKKVYYPNERKSAHYEFWEIIGKQSSAGVVNVPTTYPPRNIEPFIISGAPDAEETGFTYPEELEYELQENLDYQVNKDTPLKTSPNEASNEIIDLIDLRFRTGKYLLDRYDTEFLQITTFYLNSLHHYFWDDDKTLKGWQVIDDHLGDFLKENYNIVLMSDHGSTEIHTVFHINTWLEQEGYLSSDMGVSDTLDSVGITTERLIELTRKLRIRRLASRIIPQWILSQIPSEEGEVRREGKTPNVEWGTTTALASGQGPVYINEQISNYEEVRTNLIKMLSGITTPIGRKVAEEVFRGDEVYHGPYENEGPDIVIDQADGIHIDGGLGRDEVFTQPSDEGWRGDNKRDGIFIATGPDFSTGHIDQLSILDLAPTFLHLHGCAIPTDMDGDVRHTIFSEESPRSKYEESYIKMKSDSTSESNKSNSSNVQKRLKDLGYL